MFVDSSILRRQSSLRTRANALNNDSVPKKKILIYINGFFYINIISIKIFYNIYLPFFVNSKRLSGTLANCKINDEPLIFPGISSYNNSI